MTPHEPPSARTRRTILVTGASRGIGQAIASRLARDGFDLVVHARKEASLDATCELLHGSEGAVRRLAFDVTDRAAARAALEADIERHGAYYGVICNAGISADGAFPALSDEDWDSVIDTGLGGFYNVIKPTVMPMIRRRAPGRIVVISSVSGVIGNRGQVNYSAAKAGVIGAAKALAVELAKRRITVNCVAPGLIDTGMTEGLDLDTLLQVVPMRRQGTPEEVASLVGYLCHADSGYLTRQVISVNGGMY
ncbi:3-oxoacyl-ACP reductase FabG [Halotalea alkalilenta]|uniref:3-oxoacyl-ACP reductase FabG n=1 Tax=Halotalea alkalilenta TaxID=376489 RepID=UPI0006935E54|nr:3-oxoacyl-ACP reductase FabG [Halotalea alkalilenta]